MRTKTILLASASLFILTSCGFGNFNNARFKETRSLTRASYDTMPLSVSSHNGTIEVERNDLDNEVHITAMIRARTQERLDAVEIVADDLGNGVFEVYAIWPNNRRKNNEGVSYEISIPDAIGLDLETSNGSITIGDFSGEADLRTSNGRITVHGHDGNITADSSNGGIYLSDITGTVYADTSNGRIEVELTNDNPGPVTLDSSNGSISLEVGQAFGGELEAGTSNGRIKVRGTIEGRIYSISKNHVRLDLGGEHSTERSDIGTSNGNVTIRVRD